MDEFKRKYSNEDTLTVALPYFWDHFDREGFSIWYAEYHFPEELSMTFMSCNLITGTVRSLCLVSLNSAWNAITLFLDCSFQFRMFYLRKSFALLGFKKYVQVLSCSSPQECSNDLTNYVRMPLLVSSSSVQTTTVVSLVSGSSEARTLHFL